MEDIPPGIEAILTPSGVDVLSCVKKFAAVNGLLCEQRATLNHVGARAAGLAAAFWMYEGVTTANARLPNGQ